MVEKIPVQPLSNYILGKVEKTGSKTPGGLFLPAKVQKRTAFTEVIARGPLAAETITIGSRILFKEYAQQEFNYEGVDYVVVEDSDVLATIEEKKV